MEDVMEIEVSESESDSDTDEEDDEHVRSLVYRRGHTEEPFEEWLYNHLPSTVERAKGFAWVVVQYQSLLSMMLDPPDVAGLKDSWEQLLKSGTQANYPNIKQLALNHKVKSGKWMVFAASGAKIDYIWTVITRAIMNDQIPCDCAKVSAYDPGENRHVVCMYSEDFSDFEQVMATEQAIRKIGIKCQLIYKPDVYTHLGVYKGNEWNIKPYLYISNFDILKGTSVIEMANGVSP